MLEVAIRAAQAAGEILKDKFGQARLLAPKAHGEIVTEADLAAEGAILSILRQEFPEGSFLSEEGGGHPPSPGDSYWAIDPLDGTTNYAQGVPFFAVSIAYVSGGKVELGLVYDPLREELFQARRGMGAYLGGERLAVSGKEGLTGALVGTEWAQDPGLKEPTLTLVKLFVREVRTIRLLGAAALSLCYLAAGRLDLYFHPGLKPWDVAAAGLIIQEAGGIITGLDGREWDIHARGYLAAGPRLHREALALICTL